MTNTGDAVLAAMRTRLLSIPTLPAFRFFPNVVASPPQNLDAWSADAIQLGTKEAMHLSPPHLPQWWRWSGGLYTVSLHYPNNAGLHPALALLNIVAYTFQGSSITTDDATQTRIDIMAVRGAGATTEPTGITLPIQIGFEFTEFL